jgi:hypothetical protein
MRVSPAAPATSPGFTLSIATSSDSGDTALASASDLARASGSEPCITVAASFSQAISKGEVEDREHGHDPDVHHQPQPEAISQEQDVDENDDRDHDQHQDRDGR